MNRSTGRSSNAALCPLGVTNRRAASSSRRRGLVEQLCSIYSPIPVTVPTSERLEGDCCAVVYRATGNSGIPFF